MHLYGMSGSNTKVLFMNTKPALPDVQIDLTVNLIAFHKHVTCIMQTVVMRAS